MRKFTMSLDVLRRIAEAHWQSKSTLIAVGGTPPKECPCITDEVLNYLLEQGHITEVTETTEGH